MMTKKSYLYDRFFVSNQNFTTACVLIVKKSIFFVQNSIVFFISQFPGFFKFPGKVATLFFMRNIYNLYHWWTFTFLAYDNHFWAGWLIYTV